LKVLAIDNLASFDLGMGGNDFQILNQLLDMRFIHRGFTGKSSDTSCRIVGPTGAFRAPLPLAEASDMAFAIATAAAKFFTKVGGRELTDAEEEGIVPLNARPCPQPFPALRQRCQWSPGRTGGRNIHLTFSLVLW
jgi:hypothetical protein